MSMTDDLAALRIENNRSFRTVPGYNEDPTGTEATKTIELPITTISQPSLAPTPDANKHHETETTPPNHDVTSTTPTQRTTTSPTPISPNAASQNNPRRHSLRRESAELAFDLLKSIVVPTTRSLNYLVQTFFVSFTASMCYAAVYFLFYSSVEYERNSYIYFDVDEPSYIASVYQNGLRVVPFATPFRLVDINSYFLDPAPATSMDVHDETSAFYWLLRLGELLHPSYMSTVAAFLIFAKVIFRPNRVGDYLILLLTIMFAISSFITTSLRLTITLENLESKRPGGDGRERSFIPALICMYITTALFLPTACFIATKTSLNVKQRPHGLKVFMAMGFYEISLLGGFIVAQIIVPFYFSPETSLLLRVLIRSLALMFTLHLLMEASWQINYFLHVQCHVYGRGHFITSFPIIFVNTVGRLMQAGCEDLEVSVFLEIAAACVEITTAHSLLLGKTPALKFQQTLSHIRILLFTSKAEAKVLTDEEEIVQVRRESARDVLEKSRWKQSISLEQHNSGSGKIRIHPTNAATDAAVAADAALEKRDDDESDADASTMSVDLLREQFCINSLMYMTMSEGALTFFVFISSLAIPFNIAAPGSYRLQFGHVLGSFIVMFIGEVIISNSIVAWMSKQPRYGVDLSKAWAVRDLYLFRGFTIILAILPFRAFANVFLMLCITSWDDEVENIVFTTCPVPPESILELARVGVGWNSTWNATMEQQEEMRGGL